MLQHQHNWLARDGDRIFYFVWLCGLPLFPWGAGSEHRGVLEGMGAVSKCLKPSVLEKCWGLRMEVLKQQNLKR